MIRRLLPSARRPNSTLVAVAAPAAIALVVFAVACATGSRSIESRDILDRPAAASRVEVQHVLLGWSWLDANYRKAGMSKMDPRAEGRTEGEADALATDLLARCRAGASFDELVKQHSEDPGMGPGPGQRHSYTVDEKTPFEPAFKDLAFRLQPGECGLVKSPYGWHVMKRIK